MRHRVTAVAAALVLFGGLAACTGGGGQADGPPILDPGAPGESATPASQEQIDAAAAGLGHNEADVEYILMMIEHHGQALVMTDMVEGRVESGDIRTMADRISSAQGPEIEAMEAWMEQNVYDPAEENPNHAGFCAHGPEGGHGGHATGGSDGSPDGCPVNLDHSDMPGMASQRQLDELRSADGAEFDRLFVELMTAHHEGAITMAEEVTLEGKHPMVLRMAADVIAEQTADINRMDEIIDG
ncbi:DUF305 domain-containing protein [Streptomonospora litoralis]|uniref:DUF305 domain-containing protein n=1 Tax=Streptomonospora litoralis TaxID=2498135 RepID=A0A4P6Q8N8_9ACTN|nr:DUF305 domain-containing protein [Streptomonospora litoralis]QBI55347.1 hypothetical protein EKD16_17905 [Streptomonospora litoralis]